MILLSQNRTMHVWNLKSTDLSKFETLSINFWRDSIILKNTEDTNTESACYFSVQYCQLLKLLVCSRNNLMLWLQYVSYRQVFRKFGFKHKMFISLLWLFHFQGNWIPTSSHKDISCTFLTMLCHRFFLRYEAVFLGYIEDELR